MKKFVLISLCFIFAGLMGLSHVRFAEEPESVTLPPPRTDGGKPLMQVLKSRASSREFSPQKLDRQVLSDLLWAAGGVNRQESGKRTAPSARNWQEIDLYLAAEEALYRYDPKGHRLVKVLTEDIRAHTGKQAFVATAPVNLVYVADFSRISADDHTDKLFYSAADTGFISQNVYLFCASEGLATVVRGLVDKPALAEKMGLGPDQKVILTQTVGYPKP